MHLSFATLCRLGDGLARIDVGEHLSDKALTELRKRIWDLEKLRWTIPGKFPKVTPIFREYVNAWNANPPALQEMSQWLSLHEGYANFLSVLQQNIAIATPGHGGTGNAVGVEKGELSLSAARVFKNWAFPLGQAFSVPSPEPIRGEPMYPPGIVLGTNWDFDGFANALRHAYLRAPQTSGYANLGLLMPDVCESLTMSYQAFSYNLERFIKECPGPIRLAPATFRRFINKDLQMTLLRSRSDILVKRAEAMLLRRPVRIPKWTETCYLQNGLKIDGKQVKLIRYKK